jgi:hypothetical protein
MATNKDLVKKIPSNIFFKMVIQVIIFFSKFLTNQKKENENDSLKYKQDIEKLLESQYI